MLPALSMELIFMTVTAVMVLMDDIIVSTIGTSFTSYWSLRALSRRPHLRQMYMETMRKDSVT